MPRSVRAGAFAYIQIVKAARVSCSRCDQFADVLQRDTKSPSVTRFIARRNAQRVQRGAGKAVEYFVDDVRQFECSAADAVHGVVDHVRRCFARGHGAAEDAGGRTDGREFGRHDARLRRVPRVVSAECYGGSSPLRHGNETPFPG